MIVVYNVRVLRRLCIAVWSSFSTTLEYWHYCTVLLGDDFVAI